MKENVLANKSEENIVNTKSSTWESFFPPYIIRVDVQRPVGHSLAKLLVTRYCVLCK